MSVVGWSSDPARAMNTAANLIAAALAATLFVAGLSKLRQAEGIAPFLSSLGTSPALIPFIAYSIGAIKSVFGALLLIPATARISAILTAALMLAYATVTTTILTRGDRPDCRCFGQSDPRPISWRSVLQNLVLAGAALLTLKLRTSDIPLTVFGIGQFDVMLMSIMCSGLLILAIFHYQLLQQHGKLLQRIGVVEQLLSPAGYSRNFDLEIGAEAPWFLGRDLDGKEYDLNSVLRRQTRVLLLFVDSGCPACGAVVDRVKTWACRHPEFTLVLLNSNEKNHDKHFVLRTDERVYQDYLIRGVPALVVLDRHGRVERRSAMGPEAIQGMCVELERPVEVAT